MATFKQSWIYNFTSTSTRSSNRASRGSAGGQGTQRVLALGELKYSSVPRSGLADTLRERLHDDPLHQPVHWKARTHDSSMDISLDGLDGGCLPCLIAKDLRELLQYLQNASFSHVSNSWPAGQMWLATCLFGPQKTEQPDRLFFVLFKLSACTER